MSLSQHEPVDETAPEAIDPLQAEIEALAARAEAAEARVREQALEILELRQLLRGCIDSHCRSGLFFCGACTPARQYLSMGSESREAADAASPY